jgi:hypothetical protein
VSLLLGSHSSPFERVQRVSLENLFIVRQGLGRLGGGESFLARSLAERRLIFSSFSFGLIGYLDDTAGPRLDLDALSVFHHHASLLVSSHYDCFCDLVEIFELEVVEALDMLAAKGPNRKLYFLRA